MKSKISIFLVLLSLVLLQQGFAASNIDLGSYSGGETVSISEAGDYEISGSLIGGGIVVNCEGSAVNLILNGVTISSVDTACIYGEDLETLTITLLEGTTSNLGNDGETDYDGVIYSNSDIIVEGEGKLIVEGNAEEGISTEDKDITINGGTIVITAVDDGINAGGDNGGLISINGGNIYVNAEGDGIDSNGDLEINGGTLFVVGSTSADDSALDSDGTLAINGGTVVALGNGMLQSPDSDSLQDFLAVNVDTIDAGNIIALVDANGEKIVSFATTEKSFSTIVISSAFLDSDNYKLYKNCENTGSLVNGIYTGGVLTLGDELSVSESSSNMGGPGNIGEPREIPSDTESEEDEDVGFFEKIFNFLLGWLYD
ncbi:hypothetical protein MmarC5_0094 [Methanococcus maripaludis C5]|uniref:Carbohydrate-binding domain-containing protein n=1 Tax=Methanococcus maripaludis (strain C5 / ATCC BAA-1333) TaxID=402880 RepID=A4FW40_METM5|nr:carbohydrate-binding domain-containing protein [Methanococcus maripaludis]ABO34411.1 hypothetical protein MmarC5_0094 [Methanococcus maripaludis C5]